MTPGHSTLPQDSGRTVVANVTESVVNSVIKEGMREQRTEMKEVFNGLPIHDVSYNTNGFNTNRSVFVVPRRAYLDGRILQGKPRNIIVIIAEIHDDALKSIVACELGQKRTSKVSIVQEVGFTLWVRKNIQGSTHRVVVVQCKDFPVHAIINGSSTRLIYRKTGDHYNSRVETEKPLILRSRVQSYTPSHGKGSIVVCSTLFGQPERLNDWLKYQRTLGIDHVHFSFDTSFTKNATTLYPFLEESLRSGFTEMEEWSDIVGERMYYKGQITKYEGCLYRYIGIYEYGMFIDVDDFFNPMVPGHKDVHYYLHRFFSKYKVGSVCLQWPQMQCGPSEEHLRTLTDGNITSILTGYKVKYLPYLWKCVHRLIPTVFVKIHEVELSFPGYDSVNVKDSKLAYVAHNHVNNTC
jgi:hypothetical protein